MVNEEILTSLKNSLERGEDLQTAMKILINSGYNPKEVQEASLFIGGATSYLEQKPEEYFTMPNEKKFVKQKTEYKQNEKIMHQENVNTKKSKQKNSYTFEIFLLIILLILIGFLISLIFYKEKVIEIFNKIFNKILSI